MSGVEIVGLLLGAFPLCISAMEHYEEMRKVAGTFFKIRRAHKKDLGKIKDCQLMFKPEPEGALDTAAARRHCGPH